MTTGERSFLHRCMTPATAVLGPVIERTEIRSSMGPFRVLPEYRTVYPKAVIRALGELYGEYNRAFTPLVAVNREWASDYQYCLLDDGERTKQPINRGVQIDMVGLPDEFLQAAAGMSLEAVREILRGCIFEIENSLAMYQMLEGMFSQNGQTSFFKRQFRSALTALRRRFGRPIALLAVTDEKYAAMKAAEFGKESGEPLSAAEVFDLSGFDQFFGPDEFRKHVDENGGGCGYLLYARTSDPVAKLKNPSLPVAQPLLGDPAMRRIVKENVLTLNVDAPHWPNRDTRRINDTKAYLPPMRMAFPLAGEADILSVEFAAHLSAGKPYAAFLGFRLSRHFAAYLEAQGVDPLAAESGAVALRCKPAQGTYGCYGHVVGALPDGKFRQELRRSLRQRGLYVVQPEMKIGVIENATDGAAYTCIDRNFFADIDGCLEFLGGVRSLMPLNSLEAQRGRNHGSNLTVSAEIV